MQIVTVLPLETQAFNMFAREEYDKIVLMYNPQLHYRVSLKDFIDEVEDYYEYKIKS